MNRGSTYAKFSMHTWLSGKCFNEAPIHESGKCFGGVSKMATIGASFNEAPIHESGKCRMKDRDLVRLSKLQ